MNIKIPLSLRLDLLYRLWQHISPRRRIQFGFLLVLLILTSFSEIVTIGSIMPFLSVLTAPEHAFSHQLAQPLIRFLSLSEPQQLLLPLTIIFATSALISGVFRMTLICVQTRLSHAIGHEISTTIYRRTLYQPYSVHVGRNSGEVIGGISLKANSVVSYTILPSLTIVSSSLLMLLTLITVVTIEPFVSLATFGGFAGIYLVVILLTKKRLQEDSRRLKKAQGEIFKTMQEGLGGIRDVLIDGTQTTFCNIHRQIDASLRHAAASVQIISVIPRYGIEALSIALIAALAFWLAGRAEGFASAIPVLGVLVLSAQRLLPALQQIYSSWTYFLGGQATLGDVLDLLDQPIPKYTDRLLSQPISFEHRIKIENLSFRYSPQGSTILRNLSLTIPRGARVGVIGTTGCGKSTLLDIIMGLLPPTEGALTIDGETLTTLNRSAWQAHIAHVPQAIFLADATIAENIAFGTPPDKIDHCRVRQAAQKALISGTIEEWDQQYDTHVGERGLRLSGGQRQRIGIARALYKQADVIVFDEATSALDAETEQAVMKSIETLGCEITLLIVAHRLTTLKNCTHIVELSHGVVKRQGTYENIVGHHG